MLRAEADLGRARTDVVGRVVAGLVRAAPALDPGCLLVLGAQCRDTWSAALGRPDPVRRTYDLDLGVAVRGMDAYSALVSQLLPRGHTGIQFDVEGLPVDLMPFGEGVEDPRGVVAPPARSTEPFSVFGFDDVYRGSISWDLPVGTVRLATPEGYTVLKLAAWHDRSPLGVTKDGVDLGEVIRWHLDSATVREALWSGELLPALEAAGYDEALAAAWAAGAAARSALGHSGRTELTRLWAAAREGLPHVVRTSGQLSLDAGRVAAIVEWFGRGVTGEALDAGSGRPG